MTRDTWEMLRASMWTGLVSTQCGFAFHPGTTRDAAKPRSVDEICAEADRYMAEFDKRFHVEQGE